MKTRWTLLLGWLVWTGACVGQEEAVGGDPFAEPEAVAEEVDPFAVAGEEPPGCGNCREEADPFAAEDTDVPDGGEVDPFAADWGSLDADKIPTRRAKEVRQTVRVRVETWETEARKVIELLDDVKGVDGGGELREKILEGGKLVFSPVLGVDARSRATVESITERIYPTEYEGCAGLPSAQNERPKREEMTPVERLIESIGSQALPTAFETRNTGLTAEAGVQPVEAEAGTWDISVLLEEVRQLGCEDYGAEELAIREPVFSTFRTGGLLRVDDGKWQLLSVQEPPLGIKEQGTDKRWVTLVRVDRAR